MATLIEKDAKLLAAEILLPEDLFVLRYRQHYAEKKQAGIDELTCKKVAIIETASEFLVSNMSASYRAKELGIISETMRRKLFPVNF